MAHDVPAGARLILPAPPATKQGTGIVWFEVRVDPDDWTVVAQGFDADRNAVAESRVEAAEAALDASLSDAYGRLDLELRGDSAEGEVRIAGRIGEQAFEVAGRPGERSAVRASEVVLGDDERRLLRPWAELHPAFEALVEAVGGLEAEASDACIMLGALITLSAELCVGGDAAACSVLLSEWMLYQQHCQAPPRA